MDSTKRMALESLLGRFPFDVGAADLLRSLYLFSFYNAPRVSIATGVVEMPILSTT